MPTPRHLKSAPITEAIFDIRVTPHQGFDAKEFAPLRAKLAEAFPITDEQHGTRFAISFQPTGPATPGLASHDLHGLFFKSQDKTRIAQFRIDGFTLNKLAPYTSWQDMFSAAMALWAQYVEVAKPVDATRLAVRYLNHIPLPSGPADLDDIVRAGPHLPPELPQIMTAYFSRTTIFDEQSSNAAHITQSIQRLSSNQNVFIIDIDAFREASFPPEDAAIRATFETLHDFKNLLFFSLLTEKTLEKFA